jgi:ArsR family transcriptional regulator
MSHGPRKETASTETTMTEDEQMAACFRALSHPTRARLFRLLATDPATGASYGTLQTATRLTDATLIHHLREMERGHVVARIRKGAFVSYRIAPALFTRTVSRAIAMAGAVRLRDVA